MLSTFFCFIIIFTTILFSPFISDRSKDLDIPLHKTEDWLVLSFTSHMVDKKKDEVRERYDMVY